MPQQKLPLSFSDVERGIYALSLEEQLKLTEIIFANLKTALNGQLEQEKKDEHYVLRELCGISEDQGDGEDRVAEIYGECKKYAGPGRAL